MKKELIHRMQMLIDDAQVIIDHLNEGKEMSDATKHADDAWVHLSNIEIASDLTSKECLTWKKF